MRTPSLPALLFLVSWPLIFYWPVAIGARVFFSDDLFRVIYPFRAELARALAAGRLPLWTPGMQAGFPLLAEGQVAALYPPNLLLACLLPPGQAISYSILLHFVWAAVGMYALCRSAGLGVTGSFLSAFTFEFCGFAVAQVPHMNIWAAGSWLPWLLCFQSKFVRVGHRGIPSAIWIILLAISVAMQLLAGHAQIALMSLFTLLLFGIAGPLVWNERDSGSRLDHTILAAGVMRSLTATLASIVLGAGLAAAQLLPSAELVGLSIRGLGVSEPFFLQYSLAPAALTQLFFPFWRLGAPALVNLEFWGYLGVVPLVLAIAAPLLRRDFRTWFFVSLGILSLILALGENGVLYRTLYLVPLVNVFRVPARFLFLFSFAGAFLAGSGLEAMESRLHTAGGDKWSWASGGALVSAVGGIVILDYQTPPEFWSRAWLFLPWLFIVSASALVMIGYRRSANRVVFGALAVGISVLDLTVFHIPFSVEASPSLYSLAGTSTPGEMEDVPRSVQAMEANPALYRVIAKEFVSVPVDAVRAALWPNLPLANDKQGVIASTPLALRRNDEYIHAMSAAMFDLMNIRYYLVPAEPTANSPSPLTPSEPEGGLSITVLAQRPVIAPTRASRVEITSYTDQSSDIPDGAEVGELELGLENGGQVVLPVRLGMETADWASDSFAADVKSSHQQPTQMLSFPAYLSSVGHAFQGHKYVAERELAPGGAEVLVTSVGAQSFLPGSGLSIDHISLIDNAGRAVSMASLLHLNDLGLAFRSQTVAMWENQDVAPRAFIVHAAKTVKDDDTVTEMQQPSFQPEREVLLADDTGSSSPGGESISDGQDKITIEQYEGDHVVIAAQTDQPGWLVFADSWYPGWDATVDGRSVPIFRADYIFRAVRLDPGDHIVSFQYHPLSFLAGAAIAGLSMLVCAGWAVIAWTKSSRTRSSPSTQVAFARE